MFYIITISMMSKYNIRYKIYIFSINLHKSNSATESILLSGNFPDICSLIPNLFDTLSKRLFLL